ncbi:MAG: DUF4382 domain-containing protein [bacterium]
MMKKVLWAFIFSFLFIGINTPACASQIYPQGTYSFNGMSLGSGFSGRFLSNQQAYPGTWQARYGDSTAAYRYGSWNGPFSSYQVNTFPSFQAQRNNYAFQSPAYQSLGDWFSPAGRMSNTFPSTFMGAAQSYGNGYDALGRYNFGATQSSYYLGGNSVPYYSPFSTASSLFGSYGFGSSPMLLPGFFGYSGPRVSSSSGSTGTGSSSGSTGTGSVAVILADGPTDEYDHIYMWVTEVSLIPVSGSSSPVTIFKTNRYEDGHRGLKVDLLEFRDEDYVMTVKRGVPAGKYAKIRLEISTIETEGGPCDDIWIKLPSGKIELKPRESFSLIRGGTLSIRLDIDADKSVNLHEAGNSGKCIFRPVVFVDIEEGAPVGCCPRIVDGRIIELIKDESGTWTEGFILALDRDRGQLRVGLTEQTVIFDEDGNFSDASALYVGQEVKVRGKLDDQGVLVASLVVIGDLLDLSGEVESPVDPQTNVFLFEPSPGQEFTDDQINVKVQSQTLILLDCDNPGTTEMIMPGMKARVFGKYGNNALNAVTIILKERRVKGIITNLEEQDGCILAAIEEFGNGPVQVLIPPDTPVYLGRCRQISMSDLCTGQEVRVVLEPGKPIP